MKKRILISFAAACLLGSNLSAHAQDNNRSRELALQTNSQVSNSNQSLNPEEVIKRFTSKESELRDVFKEYSYVQESRLQVLGPGGNTVAGEYYLVSEFIFNDAGKRVERIVKAPQPTLDRAGLTLTAEDKNAFINLQPFALTAEDLSNYNVSYVGKEKLDDLNTYVFDVIPKVMSNTKELKKLKEQRVEGKYFQGRIWVDDQDLQIVKTAGKVVPEFQQRFPKFETYRENIDGRYWFPTYTYGDDELQFNQPIRIRMVVKYRNYRQFQSDVKITGVEEEVPEDKNKGGAPAKPEEKPKGRPRP
ncbi:MAG TPA: hypothetical protein VJ302_15565 [Blastocatellia bacterium]|nr:hypothetical protein [Blastocatellia bacterium]